LVEIASDQGADNSKHIKSIYHGAIPNARHSIQGTESAILRYMAFAKGWASHPQQTLRRPV